MKIKTMMVASLYKMEFEKIMNAASLAGCDLLAEGEHIRITNSKYLPASIKEKIKENKPLFLEFLNRDTQAKQVGFMIGISGEVYARSLSKSRIVYIERIGATFEYFLLKVKSYFDYFERKEMF
ncbi:hypothetical protein [Radiobacillus sp. PE A8.2]|uniref:hypothetical protein n=1 Tax=Radiobacillus sp. PE A8.2 TaxID=3380349 RepID=UPI00388DA2DB